MPGPMSPHAQAWQERHDVHIDMSLNDFLNHSQLQWSLSVYPWYGPWLYFGGYADRILGLWTPGDPVYRWHTDR